MDGRTRRTAAVEPGQLLVSWSCTYVPAPSPSPRRTCRTSQDSTEPGPACPGRRRVPGRGRDCRAGRKRLQSGRTAGAVRAVTACGRSLGRAGGPGRANTADSAGTTASGSSTAPGCSGPGSAVVGPRTHHSVTRSVTTETRFSGLGRSATRLTCSMIAAVALVRPWPFQVAVAGRAHRPPRDRAGKKI